MLDQARRGRPGRGDGWHLLPISPQISGKWFFIAAAYRYPEYKESASKFKAAFFYFAPNYTDDTLLLREYATR